MEAVDDKSAHDSDRTLAYSVGNSAKKTKITDFFKRASAASMAPDTDLETGVSHHSSSLTSSPTTQLSYKLQDLTTLPTGPYQHTSGAAVLSPKSQPLHDVDATLPRFPAPKSTRQSYLSLGQKEIFSTQCSVCLMHYNRSFPEDVRLHNSFHARFLRGFVLHGELLRLVLPCAPPVARLDQWKRFKFYEFKGPLEDKKTFKLFESVLSMISTQLGAPPLQPSDLKQHSVADGVFALSLMLFGRSCWLQEQRMRKLSVLPFSRTRLKLIDATCLCQTVMPRQYR